MDNKMREIWVFLWWEWTEGEEHLNTEEQFSISEWTNTHMNASTPGDRRNYHEALLKARNKSPLTQPLPSIAMCGSSWREELLLPRLSTEGVNNVWSQKHSATAGFPQHSKHVDSDG